MKHVAIILAGGAGTRMGGAMPKQFLSLNDKPVIVHTLERFQNNENIDAILIVCIKDWIEHLKEILDEFKMPKIKWIVEGGDTSHDATRPILPQQAIEEMLRVSHEKGNASLAIPCHETILYTQDGLSGDRQLDRSSIMRIQTPQAYNYRLIRSVYEKAEADGKHDFIYADLVCVHYGERIYFSKGFTNNIKITRKEDIPLCKSLMKFTEEELFNS